MADITDIESPVRAGDEAILFNGEITAGDVALLNGTINYEIVCRIGLRIPRVYLRNGSIAKISNYLLQV
jgi:alanine racemase